MLIVLFSFITLCEKSFSVFLQVPLAENKPGVMKKEDYNPNIFRYFKDLWHRRLVHRY